MYSIDIIKASINLYYKLEQQSIIGIKRNNIITNVFTAGTILNDTIYIKKK